MTVGLLPLGFSSCGAPGGPGSEPFYEQLTKSGTTCGSTCDAGTIDAPVSYELDAKPKAPDVNTASAEFTLGSELDFAPQVKIEPRSDMNSAVASTPTSKPATPFAVCDDVDLDTNGVPDCRQSVVENAGFNADLSRWTFDPDVKQQWMAMDAQMNPASGALAASNEASHPGGVVNVAAGTRQCVAVGSGTYKVAVQTFIAGTEGTGGAVVTLLFYKGGTECEKSGVSVGTFQSPLVSRRDAWTLIRGTAVAPAGTTSMAVRLGVVKMPGEKPLKVLFDNVLVAP